MISLYLYTKQNTIIKSILEKTLDHLAIDYADTEDYLFNDIYIIEIHTIQDLSFIEKINRTYSPLIYIVGKRNYDFIDHSILKGIDMYFDIDNLAEDIYKKKKDLLQQINNRFQFYTIKRGGLKVNLRLSQIMYVESMNHHIIIHSLSGEVVERNSLTHFMEEMNPSFLLQVHKSYVVNPTFIKEVKSKQIILNNGAIIPIGKKYENIVITL